MGRFYSHNWFVEILLIIGFLILAGVLAYLGHLQAKKRREAFFSLANELGFTFRPDRDAGFARRFGFLEHLDDGSQRYAFNILSGQLGGQQAHIFDYHYETYSRNSKGNRTTHHHYFSIFTLALPAAFPELRITREHFFSKLGQAFGLDDIDFESVEFSKRFNVKSRDKKFAYDFCNAQMIDYLLRQEDLIIEVEGNILSLTFKGQLAIERIRPNIDRLLKIRSLMPDYLFTN